MMSLSTPLTFLTMSEAILEQQDIKNQEAAQEWEQTKKEHKEFCEAHGKEMDLKINELAKEMGIDPNDYVETVERTDPTEVLEVEHRECYGLN